MRIKINKTIQSVIVVFVSIVFSVVFAPLGSLLDELLIGTCKTGLFLVVFNFFDWGCYLQGFVYSYIFLLSTLSFFVFSKSRALAVFLISTAFFWVIYFVYTMFITSSFKDVSFKSIESLIIMLVMFALGWLLAKGLLYAKINLMQNKK